jgi:hypothetical protein
MWLEVPRKLHSGRNRLPVAQVVTLRQSYGPELLLVMIIDLLQHFRSVADNRFTIPGGGHASPSRIQSTGVRTLEKIKEENQVSSEEAMRLYLERVGQLTRSLSGPDLMGSKRRTPTMEDSDRFREMVKSQSNTNRQVLYLGLFLILVVFITALEAAVRSGASPVAVLGIAGIGAGFEAGLLTWVLRLRAGYIEFSFLLILSQRLGPEDLTKAVLALFEGRRANKNRINKRLAAIDDPAN